VKTASYSCVARLFSANPITKGVCDECFQKFAAVLALAASAMTTVNASVTQSSNPASIDLYQAWGFHYLGGVTLAQGTQQVTGLTSSATIWDQGWGGQTDGNGLMISLFNGSSDLYNFHVAAANHDVRFETFDINSFPSLLDGLNNALKQIDWSNAPDVSLQLNANPVGWPGWELHVRDAAFNVTSEVPEPAPHILIAAGLIGFLLTRRRLNA